MPLPKRFMRWYYWVSAGLAGVAVLSALTIILVSKTELAVAQTTNVRGWAWSGTAGWVSLASSNCAELNQRTPGSCTAGASYGVSLALDSATSGSMSGWGWSQHAGWVCFGSSCGGDPPGADTSPDVSFSCKDLDGSALSCDKLSWRKCSTSNKLCSQDADCGEGATCDHTGSAPAVNLTGWAKVVSLGGEGWIDLRGQLAEGTDWTWSKLFFERGQCSNDPDQLCTVNAHCGVGGECLPDSTAGAGLGGWGYQYAGGTALDPYGMGWVSFDVEQPEVLFPYLQAQGGDVFSGQGVRTAFPPPRDRYNAQYLVHVRGASPSDLSARFRSRCIDNVCRQRSYELELPQDPTGDAPYTFRLGRFDFQGLMQANTSGVNTYGHQVVRLGDTGVLPGTVGSPRQNDALGGRVYVLTPSDLTYTLSAPIEFKNGAANENGSGTIIVRGNLQVNHSVSYQAQSVAERQRLASVVWIVLGDVRVAPSVTTVAGTFIILGRRAAGERIGVCRGGSEPGAACGPSAPCAGGGTCEPLGVCVTPTGQACTASCPLGQQCVPNPAQPGQNQCVVAGSTACTAAAQCAGPGEQCRTTCLLKDAEGNLRPDCGRFVSGDDSALPTKVALAVSGSVFARQFKLERTYVDPVAKDPAERFVADGRLQLNPPPGMADFAKGLPTFRRQ